MLKGNKLAFFLLFTDSLLLAAAGCGGKNTAPKASSSESEISFSSSSSVYSSGAGSAAKVEVTESGVKIDSADVKIEIPAQ